MRDFLKKNLLAILVCLFAAFTYASASTITRPYSAADYAGGTKAVGAKVNAEFASIVSWLNGGNIGSDNIATGGVATANIASFAVTTAKLNGGAVTLDKLEAAHIYVTSSSSVSQAAAQPTPAVITNLSTTFTATGRPVNVSLEAYPAPYILNGVTTYGSGVTAIADGTIGASGAIFFVRDSSTTAHFPILNFVSSGIAVGAPTYTAIPYQCADFHYTEIGLTSGVSYTFSAKASSVNGSSSVIVLNCRLVVREW